MDKRKKVRRAASIKPNTEQRDGNFWRGKEAVFFRVLEETRKQVLPDFWCRFFLHAIGIGKSREQNCSYTY